MLKLFGRPKLPETLNQNAKSYLIITRRSLSGPESPKGFEAFVLQEFLKMSAS